MKKTLIALILAGVLLIGGIVTGVVIWNSPSVVAARVITGVTDDFLDREEVSPIVDILEGGSIEASMSSISVDGQEYLDDASLTGKIYFSKDALYIDDVNVTSSGKGFAGEAYISKNTVYIREENIFNGAYGVDYSSFAKDLANSIFAADSGSDYALDEETYDRIISAFENFDQNEKIAKDAEKLLNKLTKDFWEIILDNAEIASETTQIRLNGERKSVRLITVTVDGDDMEQIIEDIYDYLCDSEDIVEFLEKYNDLLVSAMGDAFDDGSYDSLAEAYEEWLEDNEDSIDELCEEISEEFETITVKIATPKTNSTLLKLEIEVDKETVFSIDCGVKGLKKTDKIKVEMENAQVIYAIKENSKKAFEAELAITEYNTTVKYSVAINKETSKYTAKYSYDYVSGYSDYYNESYEYNVKGTFENKGDKSTITVDKIYNDDSIAKLDLVVIADTNDRMPSLSKGYKTVDEITENDVDRWIDKLEEIF